jgi:hypothetical protein
MFEEDGFRKEVTTSDVACLGRKRLAGMFRNADNNLNFQAIYLRKPCRKQTKL